MTSKMCLEKKMPNRIMDVFFKKVNYKVNLERGPMLILSDIATLKDGFWKTCPTSGFWPLTCP